LQLKPKRFRVIERPEEIKSMSNEQDIALKISTGQSIPGLLNAVIMLEAASERNSFRSIQLNTLLLTFREKEEGIRKAKVIAEKAQL